VVFSSQAHAHVDDESIKTKITIVYTYIVHLTYGKFCSAIRKRLSTRLIVNQHTFTFSFVVNEGVSKGLLINSMEKPAV